MNPNVIRLMGGFGNQLFQYAFGKAQKENGIEVKYDISKYAKRHHRYYMLDKFQMDLEFSVFLWPKTIVDSSSKPNFDIFYLKMQGYNFFGYWQYLAYFENLLPILRDEIRLKKEYETNKFLKLKEKIENEESIAVHVRRDDYLTSNTISPLPMSYYYEALKEVNGNLYFFSDDIAWCKRIFKKQYFKRELNFVDMDYYHDFELMRSCKHIITANSTFSWWAAILNDNSDKKVITPDYWITRYDHNERNNFPGDWIKLAM